MTAADTVETRETEVLRAENLTVRYESVVALSVASLTLDPGTFLAVTGPSGAGKSTLLWCLAGAIRPEHGEVTFGDLTVTDRSTAARAGIALIPQGNGLATTLTAHENVIVPMLAAGVTPRVAQERAAKALDDVGLEESSNHLIEELSGGQQQRAAVARTLASRAHVILADEPTSDLDATTRERILTLLTAEQRAGATVVMATNDPEAAAHADGEVALEEGVMHWTRPLPSAANHP